MQRNNENIDQIFCNALMNISIDPLSYSWVDLVDRLSKKEMKEAVQTPKPRKHEKDYLNTCNNWPGLAY
jgi:hypothetical protein